MALKWPSLPYFRSRMDTTVSALVLLLLLPAGRCFAWGTTGHAYASNLAIDCLPARLRPMYEANRAWIARHSIDPDDWRKDNFAEEAPRHFIDLDAAGAEAVSAYPEDYWVAVGIWGKRAVDTNGTVPWRVGEYYGKLVRAYRSRDARAIVEISSWLGHYVGDAHVPFHATVDYDGQSTGQKGIHARFETGLLDQLIKPADLNARSAVVIKNPVNAAFQWLRTSLTLCPEILAADKRAILKDADLGYNYYAEFALRARPIAIRRLEESAQDTASLWLSAWIEAGRPQLPEPVDVHAGMPLNARTHDPDRPAETPVAAPEKS